MKSCLKIFNRNSPGSEAVASWSNATTLADDSDNSDNLDDSGYVDVLIILMMVLMILPFCHFPLCQFRRKERSNSKLFLHSLGRDLSEL